MYNWVIGITWMLWLVTLAGVIFRLPIFFNRRRWACLAFVLVPMVGVPLARTAASPEEKAQLAREAAFQAEHERAANEAPSEVELTKTTWAATCGGSCLSLSGTITNSSDQDRKDPIIKCTFEGESGTIISVRRETLYRAIPAGKAVRFRGLDMGFRPEQSTTTTCGVLASSKG